MQSTGQLLVRAPTLMGFSRQRDTSEFIHDHLLAPATAHFVSTHCRRPLGQALLRCHLLAAALRQHIAPSHRRPL